MAARGHDSETRQEALIPDLPGQSTNDGHRDLGRPTKEQSLKTVESLIRESRRLLPGISVDWPLKHIVRPLIWLP